MNVKINLGHHAYKAIPNGEVEVDEIIKYNEKTRTHLDSFEYILNPGVELAKRPISLLNKYFEKNETNTYVIKADTGVGKTHSFIELMKNQKFVPFISIVSRVSLAQDHYLKFTEEDENKSQKLQQNIKIYKKNGVNVKLHEGDSIVITIDSLYRLMSYDFSNYIIFMDEFASLVEYLLCYERLSTVRVKTFLLLRRIIQTARFVYCCDADINETCLKLVPHAKVISHTKKHNNGVKATEVFDKNTLVEEIVKHDKYVLCCDSKMEAKKFMEELMTIREDKEGELPILLITSETKDELMQNLNLDNHPRVIYSPKIVYGLDSQLKRPVFGYYTRKSITSAGMMQQICRCRNITELMFMFANQDIEKAIYHSKEHCLDEMKKRECIANDIAEFRSYVDENVSKLFLDLLGDTEYSQDCDSTNKRYHFINKLLVKGFVHTQEFNLETEMDKENEKALKEEISAQDLQNLPEISEKLNETLKIDEDRISEFSDIFLKPGLSEKHFNYCDIFIKDNDEYTLKKMTDNNGVITDLPVKAVMSDNSKMIFVRKFINDTSNQIGFKSN